MEKDEEVLIKYTRQFGEIDYGRPIYIVEDYEGIKKFLEGHPELKKKYFLASNRLINIEVMKAREELIVIDWQNIDVIRGLIKTGVLDNPNVKVKLVLNPNKQETGTFPEIRNELGKYMDSIYEAEYLFPGFIDIEEEGWSEEDILCFVSKKDNEYRQFFINRLYPERKVQEVVESVPEYKDKFLFLYSEDTGTMVINVDNYNGTTPVRIYSDDSVELQYLGDSPSEQDYEKLLKFMKTDGRDLHYIVNLKSMKGEIPKEFIEYATENDVDISVNLDIPGRENTSYTKYELKDFIAIKEKLAELVSGIDSNLSDYEKFSIIYKRICKNIVYDHPVAYPKTEEEKEYSRENMPGAQNLKNGLLFGKTVCAGYAVILRQALEELGIEAQYVEGKILDKPITRKKYEEIKDEPDNQNKGIYKEEEDSLTLYERHAWVKVNINGVWYNCDPTWDVDQLRRGDEPRYCLISDDTISKGQNGEVQRVEITGPECREDYSKDKIARTFDENHFFVGNLRIPKPTRQINRLRIVLLETADLVKYDISNLFKKFKKEKPKLNEGAFSTNEEDKKENSGQSNMDRYIVGAIHVDGKNEKKEKIEDIEDREL